MPRMLRTYLLGCLAIAAAYLLLHAGEPLRLDLCDARSDAGHLYRVLALLGVHDAGVHRGLALALSVLGAWCLFQYARRMWDATTALLATALLVTSLLWLETADGLDRPPLVLAGCFLALWGLVRELESPGSAGARSSAKHCGEPIETGQRRHAAASACGAFVCMLAGSDLWLFLPAGLLFTIHARLGDPFTRRNLRFGVPGALGCLAGVIAGALITGDAVNANLDASLDAAAPGMVWRATVVLTPLCWITVGLACWRALRAATLRGALEDAATWMLAATAVGLAVAGTSGRMIDALPALPFYAIGSALVIARLLTAGGLRRALGLAWAAAAPVWAFAIVLAHPRTVLDRDDVDQVRTYLAGADRNDFVITNLVTDRVIEVAFDRHAVPVVERGEDAQDARDALLARRSMLLLLEETGTDYLHAVIIQSPATPSREALDRLTAVGAQPVLHLRNLDVYRVDRAAVLAVAGRSLPVVRQLDLGSAASDPHKLLGWKDPELTDDGFGVSDIEGYGACANPIAPPRADAPAPNACETAQTPAGVHSIEERHVDRAQLMIRVDRPCDLHLTLTLASASRPWLLRWFTATPRFGLAINGFTASECAAESPAELWVPARVVHAGINVLTIAKRAAGPPEPRGDLRALTIDPVCDR